MEIIVALISGLCVAIPSIIATLCSSKANKDLIMFRIESLEKKVEKHNTVVERMALAENNIKAIWRNVDELKEDKNEK